MNSQLLQCPIDIRSLIYSQLEVEDCIAYVAFEPHKCLAKFSATDGPFLPQDLLDLPSIAGRMLENSIFYGFFSMGTR